MADQSASFYGSCCFFPGDVKLTLGTGAFLDINVGSVPTVSKRGSGNIDYFCIKKKEGESIVLLNSYFTGFYPLISWKYKEEKVCVLEGACHDCGTVINWAQSIGILLLSSFIISFIFSVLLTDKYF